MSSPRASRTMARGRRMSSIRERSIASAPNVVFPCTLDGEGGLHVSYSFVWVNQLQM